LLRDVNFPLQPLTSILSPLERGGAREDTCVLEQSGSIAANSVSMARSTALRSRHRCRSAHPLWSSRLPVAQTRSRVETRLQRFSQELFKHYCHTLGATEKELRAIQSSSHSLAIFLLVVQNFWAAWDLADAGVVLFIDRRRELLLVHCHS
jgi:hypothetical protein